MEFYKCQLCGNIITFLNSSGVVPQCCGSMMSKLTENTVDASQEKHIPVTDSVTGRVHVKVGSVAHPMQNVHYIEWIAVETQNGVAQIKKLQPEEVPEAVFEIADGDRAVKLYAYCNLHGLWSATV